MRLDKQLQLDLQLKQMAEEEEKILQYQEVMEACLKLKQAKMD